MLTAERINSRREDCIFSTAPLFAAGTFLALFSCGLLAAAPAATPSSAALAAFNQKKYSEAFRLFKISAAAGDPDAELMLGFLYAHGEGAPRDDTQARQWFSLALAKADVISRASSSAAAAALARSTLQEAQNFVASHQNAPASIGSVYTGDRYRDPFEPLAGGESKKGKRFSPKDFNIHHLVLNGIMNDERSSYALFTDDVYGVSFMLRQGRLYNDKGKVVPGIWGTVNERRKTAELVTSDKDVQPFRMGEADKE
ncbi:MAG: tetratricopeptide repeat protein [Elusimicrobiota bacterium]